MPFLFGLAGPAEADLAMGAGVQCLGVFLTFVAAYFCLVFRSRIAAGFGAVVWIFLTLLFLPWRDFSPEPSHDPDMPPIQATFRSLAWWWVAATLSLVLTALRAFWPRQSCQVSVKPDTTAG